MTLHCITQVAPPPSPAPPSLTSTPPPPSPASVAPQTPDPCAGISQSGTLRRRSARARPHAPAGVPVARLLILAGADVGKRNKARAAAALCAAFVSLIRVQEGLTCCDEARADGKSEFVAFIQAVEQDLAAAARAAQGDTSRHHALILETFAKFDASGKHGAGRAQELPPPVDCGRKFKFSTSRATLRVKTTVEVLLEEQKEAAAAADGRGGAAAAPAPVQKPKSRIMFSS